MLMNMPRPTALTPQEIQIALRHLPNWDIVERTPAGSDHSHTELHRLFEFSSFPEAMHFMLTAARFIQMTDHHPSWQNTYSKVEVWITTGELKHRLSSKDVTLAHYLEGLFQHYKESLIP
jgi:4a-hydroxytetrahydrobiopterin dehydratase